MEKAVRRETQTDLGQYTPTTHTSPVNPPLLQEHTGLSKEEHW